MQPEGIPRQDPTPPVFQHGDPKLGEPDVARQTRYNRTVRMLKRLRHDNADLAELSSLWAAIDGLAD